MTNTQGKAHKQSPKMTIRLGNLVRRLTLQSVDNNSQCIKVMFICGEWGSRKGGLSTFNRQLAANLAKTSNERIKVHCYVSESAEEDRQDASRQGVNLITAKRTPGSSDPLEWLKIPPAELPYPDIVVAHGRNFGSAAYHVSDRTKCSWLHFVHVFCEDLGKFKLDGGATSDAIAENEEKGRQELELCEAADRVVAVGVGLQQKYERCIPNIKVVTPGIFEMLASIHLQARQTGRWFRVFVVGRDSFEDFSLKGYDIAGKAVASLGRKFELVFVGARQQEHRKIENWFLERTKIARRQLTIRSFRDYQEMKKMFREADLIVMPSRTEGFGLVALEAISAGVPVLVSRECGIASALEEVEGGMSVVVDSDLPDDWANRIRALSEQKSEERHASAIKLREEYEKKYSWKKECEKLEQMILELVQRPQKAPPLYSRVHSAETPRRRYTEGFEHVHLEGSFQSIAFPSTSNNTREESKEEGKVTTGDSSAREHKKKLSQLHSAAQHGDIAKIKSLLSLGFPVDSRDHNGKTPLMMAVLEDKIEAVNSLLDHGANPLLEDNRKRSSIHHVAKGGNITLINMMLSKVLAVNSRNTGADLRDATNTTPLMYAALYSKPEMVKFLLEEGADPSLQDNDGLNSLHCASEGGDPEVMEHLLCHVADGTFDSRDATNMTPLMYGALNGKLQIVKYLLEKGADPSLEDSNGWNLLHFASEGGDPEVIDVLLNHVPNIESRTAVGITPLMIATRNAKLNAIKFLLQKGADPTVEDKMGKNSLHHTSSHDPEVMKLLQSHMAN